MILRSAVALCTSILTISCFRCVLELFSCASTGGRFDVCMPSFEHTRFLSSIKSDPGAFNRMLEAVSSERSSCSRKEDCESIFGSIRSTCGFAQVDSVCLRAISRSLVALLRQKLLMLSSSETHEALLQRCDWTRSLGLLLWKEGDLVAAAAALKSANSLSAAARGEFHRVTILCMRDYGGALRAMNNMALAQSVITQVQLRAQRRELHDFFCRVSLYVVNISGPMIPKLSYQWHCLLTCTSSVGNILKPANCTATVLLSAQK